MGPRIPEVDEVANLSNEKTTIVLGSQEISSFFTKLPAQKAVIRVETTGSKMPGYVWLDLQALEARRPLMGKAF